MRITMQGKEVEKEWTFDVRSCLRGSADNSAERRISKSIPIQFFEKEIDLPHPDKPTFKDLGGTPILVVGSLLGA